MDNHQATDSRNAQSIINQPNESVKSISEKDKRITSHRRFINFNTHPYIKNKYRLVKRILDIKEEKAGNVNVKLPVYRQESVIINLKPNLSAEGVVYLTQLGGCSKNLFVFLAQYKVDDDTSIFLFNKQVRTQFKEFCSLVGIEHKDSSVTQSLKDLSKKNVILNISTGRYMLNPFLLLCRNEETRDRCIYAYSKCLIDKNKDTVMNFLPCY